MRSLIILVAASLAGAALADEWNEFPKHRENPYYPDELQRKGIEGWGLLSVRVTQAGAVSDAFVVDSSGEEAVENAVLSAVKQWRWTPRAVDRCAVRLRLALQLEDARSSPDASRRSSRFDAALARGDLAAARRELAGFAPRSLGEHAMREIMRARLADRDGDTAARLIALMREASGVSLENRTGESREWAKNLLNHELHALVVAGQYGEAAFLARSLAADGVLVPELERTAQELEALQRGTRSLETPGVARRLAVSPDAPSHWSAPLLRGVFQLDLDAGSIERAELCCDHASLDVTPGVETRVPVGAGSCRVQVRGAEGSRFTLREQPFEAPAADAAPGVTAEPPPL